MLDVSKSKKAVVLLSGGLDSSTLAYFVKNMNYEVYAVSFDYGQRHRRELDAAEKIGKLVGVKDHKFIKIDLRSIGGSALTSDIDIPNKKNVEEILDSKDIPITYVPARNTIFLSIAIAYAEVIDADVVFYGANCIDYSGYPDCRPEFIDAFNNLVKLGTKKGVEGRTIRIEAPFLFYTKKDIVKTALNLGVPIEMTWSCYDDGDKPCGRCDSCILRENAIKEVYAEIRKKK
ncbi:MAG: 7-cyano-7-deazaguanine synthase QueC [Candidatus Methanoliparum thermophilum]|uniref:7-cyano-7-deazaguanine synthase n=1 Tax=Methanoliparum thermophilum TaxID=2491083 RepID=A0A520KRQ3_METT2|nr:MAG: 7-cyano-7-deazaguanine synthase QueC [Candidatus Methanoliparum thermophilum]BDC35943.1 7-cyano-7-deazaguanine synthase [Candidatus Methanoliparum sp. LAM-1]